MLEEDGDIGGGTIPPHHGVPHYHGDAVRVIFVVSALVLIIAQSMGAELPLSTFGTVVTAVILVIAAGITNPSQSWIHWINELIALIGTLLFGTNAIEHYRAGLSFFDVSFLSSETLTLLFLIALYFTTRTIRGIVRRAKLY